MAQSGVGAGEWGCIRLENPAKEVGVEFLSFLFFLRFNCKGEEGRSTQIYPSLSRIRAES